MQSVRVLAALLDYPTEETVAALDEMAEILAREAIVGDDDQAALAALFEELRTTDLYELQARWIELFDQSRSLSLHLFEHVHGESRDRGQAMVDLLERYREQGLELSARELPDYLPVFLEYLSQLPPDTARAELGEPVVIIAALAERLQKRASRYAALFAALEHLADARPDSSELDELAAEETDDGGAQALDAEHEEEPVDFMKRETTLVGRQHARALGAARRAAEGAAGGPVGDPPRERSLDGTGSGHEIHEVDEKGAET